MENRNKISEVKREPLISVIVPAFNIEEYLERCVRSILTQSYAHIEIILVDDGSTDRTGQIADEFALQYSQKVICIHKKNMGVLQARLTGIMAARGEWIGFVDGDDMIEEDMYERLINNARIYQADISHCGYKTVVNEGERVHYFYNTGKIAEHQKIDALVELLRGNFVEPGVWNKLFKKKLFDNLVKEQIMAEQIRINEDLLMNYFLFKKANKSVYEDFCPYLYMVRKTSATRSNMTMEKILDTVKVRRYILEDVDENLRLIAYKKYLICCREAYCALYGRSEAREICKELKSEMKKQKKQWEVLNKVDRFKLQLIMISPLAYKIIYKIYEKTFQNKIYE